MNKNIKTIFVILMLTATILAGCISGGESSSEAFDGSAESLLLTKDDLPEKYGEFFEVEQITDAEELFSDNTTGPKLGFKEAYAVTSMFFDEEFNFGIFAQLVIRFELDKMDQVLGEYKASQEEDNEEFESVDFGKIGDETYGIKITDEEFGSELYQIAFIKKDIMVVLIVTGEEDSKAFIKDLAENIESRI